MALAYYRVPRAMGGELRVVEVDETCINKKKRNPLARPPPRAQNGRAERRWGAPINRNARRTGQRWMWGIADALDHTVNFARLIPGQYGVRNMPIVNPRPHPILPG